jgi:hypothetical protein
MAACVSSLLSMLSSSFTVMPLLALLLLSLVLLPVPRQW